MLYILSRCVLMTRVFTLNFVNRLHGLHDVCRDAILLELCLQFFVFASITCKTTRVLLGPATTQSPCRCFE